MFWRTRILSKETLAQLSKLTYREDAKRKLCILPLASIYWDDELPELDRFQAFSEPDRTRVLRAFAIRMKLWSRQPLSGDEHQFWDRMCLAAPNWALFHRLVLSEDDQRARDAAERECARDFEQLFAAADEVKVTEGKDGIQRFSATFQLNKSQSDKPIAHVSGATPAKKRWWKFWA